MQKVYYLRKVEKLYHLWKQLYKNAKYWFVVVCRSVKKKA